MVTNRAAKALAAFELRSVATNDDVASIISMCLRHRLRKDPLESIDSGTKVREVFETVFA